MRANWPPRQRVSTRRDERRTRPTGFEPVTFGSVDRGSFECFAACLAAFGPTGTACAALCAAFVAVKHHETPSLRRANGTVPVLALEV
jgi:hypothetical protein